MLQARLYNPHPAASGPLRLFVFLFLSSSSPLIPPPLPLPLLVVSLFVSGGDVSPQAACFGHPATPGGRPLDPGEEARRGILERGEEGGRGDEGPRGESGRGYGGRGGDGGRGDPSCPNPQGGGDRRGAGAGTPPALPAGLRAQGGGRRHFPLHRRLWGRALTTHLR